MHRRELTLEVHGFKRRAGSLRTGMHVALALSRDKRFKAIARSGFWILAKWDLETGDIADVAARCLSESDRPLTEAELFPLIAARRPVKLNSIMSSLREDGRFRRVGPRTWELKRASARRLLDSLFGAARYIFSKLLVTEEQATGFNPTAACGVAKVAGYAESVATFQRFFDHTQSSRDDIRTP